MTRQRAARRGELAIRAFQEADHLDAMPRLSLGDEVVYSADAKRARQRGEALLQPERPVHVSLGEAITWENAQDDPHKGARGFIVETLEHPDTVTAAASSDRMNAAHGVGILEPALDAAQAARARNSIEKMLAHQLAAAHHTAMRLLEASTNERLQPGDRARLTNASARMMDVYQAGTLALLKLKTKGQQRVLVQYVSVGAGGQAVVAGRLGRGSRTRGRRTKSKDEPHEP